MTEEELILSGVATTYDYLEKIFQIPFTLKPIQHDARKELIKYLMESEMEKEPPSSSDEEERKNQVDDDNKIDVSDEKQPHKDDSSDGSGVEQVIQNDEKGYSVFAQELIDALNDPMYDDASSFSDFIEKAAVSPKLKNVLKTGIGADALEMTIGLYRKNIALVSRFSFRTINVNTEGD